MQSIPPDIFVFLVNQALSSDSDHVEYYLDCIEREDHSVIANEMMSQPLLQSEFPVVESIENSSRASFPLRLRNTSQYAANRIALVGYCWTLIGRDAAHIVHPLAGQGLNLGLSDVASLSKAIYDAYKTGQDYGNRSTLHAYANDCYISNLAMMSAIDKLQKLFMNEYDTVAWLRSNGMHLLDSLPILKKQIMNIAMH